MGAIIALKLSTEFSEISRLFLIDPVLPGPKFSAYGRLKKFFRLNKTSHMVLAAKNRRFEFASKQKHSITLKVEEPINPGMMIFCKIT